MSALLPNALPSTMDQAVRSHMSGQTVQAESLYRSVLANEPLHPQATQFLGVLLFQTGQREEGLNLLESGIKAAPEDSEAWSNLGNAYRVLERYEEAVTVLRRAISLNPDNGPAHCTLAACLRREGSLTESVEHARTAIRLQPNLAQAHLNLGNTLLNSGDTAGAIVALDQALYTNPGFLEAHQVLTFAMQYSDRHTAEDIGRAAARLGSLFPAVELKVPDRPLKTIAFLSGDLRRHPVAYFLEPLLKALDRSKFQVVLLSNSHQTDEWSERLRSCTAEWHDVADLTADSMRQLSATLEIDVLIDLSGHTAANRIDVVAGRLAPVQVSWLGYSGTTGLKSMDWILADDTLVPTSHESNYCEKVARLPRSAFCFNPDRITTPVSDPPCLKNGHVTFGSFNNIAKISPSTVAVWADILKRAKGSRLLLKSIHLGEDRISHRLRQQFVLRGIDPESLTISGYVPTGDHFNAYADVDIALDPFPYTGATTTVEALHMGVPLVTLAGDRYAARMSASFLHEIGRDEWIATTKAQYVDKAVGLASDPTALGSVRQSLRSEVGRSPLCQAGQFAQDFANALESIWSQAQNAR